MVAIRQDDLKKGKSRVIEEGHHLILGWNDKLIPLIHELAVANESENGGVIVILAEREKEQMEEEIASVFDEKSLLGSTVVCRGGNPMLVSDLEKVSAGACKSDSLSITRCYESCMNSRTHAITHSLYNTCSECQEHHCIVQ